MILKGSQRSGAANLSTHLLNDRDNDHVTVYELRGFVGRDLHQALAEAHAISKGTKCEQFMFSLSLSPPKNADVSEQDLIDAVERSEQALGLDGQPRAIIFHEKEGRRHAHAVWSRIDPSTMKAINLPHFKNRLTTLSRELYLEHGWELPQGLRRDGGRSPLNFTLAEWQQAKRLKLHPSEIKQSFQEAWKVSDSPAAFAHALEDRGYFLAHGDRRGFVALNIDGEVFSVPRMLGAKTKEVKARLGDPQELRSVEETLDHINERVSDKLRDFVDDVDRKHGADMQPLAEQRSKMVSHHREERAKLAQAQNQRWAQETKDRAAKLNTGLRGLWDKLRGQSSKIQNQNEREAWQGMKRDQEQRDYLVRAQMKDRQALQSEIEKIRRKHAQDRKLLARELAQTMRVQNDLNDTEQTRNRNQRLLSHDLRP
jgi:hypothetical protein